MSEEKTDKNREADEQRKELDDLEVRDEDAKDVKGGQKTGGSSAADVLPTENVSLN
jgi:hypothetical protein